MSVVFYLLNFSALFSYIFPFAHKQFFYSFKAIIWQPKAHVFSLFNQRKFLPLKIRLILVTTPFLTIRVSLDARIENVAVFHTF